MSKMQTLISDQDSRIYPSKPLVGVGGIIFDGDRVLLGLRGKEPGKGKWSIPGGAVKVGETLEEALKREISEEVGISVVVKDIVAVLDRIIKDENGNIAYHYILVDFLCIPADHSIPKPGSDLIDCRYVRVDEIGHYNLTRGTASVVKQVFDYIKGLSPKMPVYNPDSASNAFSYLHP